jgi:hypothetical protein
MITQTREPVLTGGCQCGAVRYAIYAEPKGFSICHCRMCQKAVGGPFAALVPNQPADFAWTRGSPGTFASSTIAMRDFCRDCGTPLAYRGPSGRINVSLGSLDDPSAVRPNLETGIEGRHGWVAPIAGLPSLSTEQELADPAYAEIMRRFRSLQHPDHDTPHGWSAATQATP